MKKMMDDRLGPTAQGGGGGGGSVDSVEEPRDVLGGLPGALALKIEDWAVRLHGSAGIKAIAMLECTSTGCRGHFRRTLPATAAAPSSSPPARRTEYELALANEAAAMRAQAVAERASRRRHQRLVYKQRRVEAAIFYIKHRQEKNAGIKMWHGGMPCHRLP